MNECRGADWCEGGGKAISQPYSFSSVVKLVALMLGTFHSPLFAPGGKLAAWAVGSIPQSSPCCL